LLQRTLKLWCRKFDGLSEEKKKTQMFFFAVATLGPLAARAAKRLCCSARKEPVLR
jgi:hypothetical protein